MKIKLYIVAYNNDQALNACLQSLEDTTELPVEIFVINNYSQINIDPKFKVHLLNNPTNNESIFDSLNPSLRLVLSNSDELWDIYIETNVNGKERRAGLKDAEASSAHQLLGKFHEAMEDINFQLHGAINNADYLQESVEEMKSVQQQVKTLATKAVIKSDRSFHFNISELPIKLPMRNIRKWITFTLGLIPMLPSGEDSGLITIKTL